MIKQILTKIMELWFGYIKNLVKGQTDYPTIEETLKKFAPKSKMQITDWFYNLTDNKTINNLLWLNITSHREWQKEKYDCEDFSFSLMGIFRNLVPNFAVGIVFVDRAKHKDKHALNFFIDDKLRIFYIEPQSNEIMFAPLKKDYRPYFWMI